MKIARALSMFFRERDVTLECVEMPAAAQIRAVPRRTFLTVASPGRPVLARSIWAINGYVFIILSIVGIMFCPFCCADIL